MGERRFGRTRRIGTGVAAMLVAVVCVGGPGAPARGDDGDAGAERVIDLGPTLERLCRKNTVPALAAAGIKGGELWGIGVAGDRQSGMDSPVQIDDRWDLGSCGMAMTATLAALLVDEGVIGWESTIEEVLPQVVDSAREEYRSVTLAQLLTHTSGLPKLEDPDEGLWRIIRAATGTLPERRLVISKIALRQMPEMDAGEKVRFTHLGYVVAGAMLEQAAGEPFEDLMRERLFEPLGMTTAGFGLPGTPGTQDQPVGHEVGYGNWVKPIQPTPDADLPEAMSPAGTVSCSIGDWAKFAMLHLRAARGEEGLLVSTEGFGILHTDMMRRNRQAMGWELGGQIWAGGMMLRHGSVNEHWYGGIWIAPKANVAIVAVSNRGDGQAVTAANNCVTAIVFNELFDPAGEDNGRE